MRMNFYGQRVLFLGAHPDDIELGCGALIHHIAPMSDVLCVTLSDNQKNPLLKNVVQEHFKAMEVLGVTKDKVVLGQFTTRIFQDARQEILEYFLKLRNDFKPDIIFVHSKQDVHQDHNTMTDESLRAFRGSHCWASMWFDPPMDSFRIFWSRSARKMSMQRSKLSRNMKPIATNIISTAI